MPPPGYGHAVMQRPKAQRVKSAVIVGLLWVLGSHLLLKNGWGLVLFEGLFCGLGQFSVISYIHSGDDRPKHDGSAGTVR